MYIIEKDRDMYNRGEVYREVDIRDRRRDMYIDGEICIETERYV